MSKKSGSSTGPQRPGSGETGGGRGQPHGGGSSRHVGWPAGW